MGFVCVHSLTSKCTIVTQFFIARYVQRQLKHKDLRISSELQFCSKRQATWKKRSKRCHVNSAVLNWSTKIEQSSDNKELTFIGCETQIINNLFATSDNSA